LTGSGAGSAVSGSVIDRDRDFGSTAGVFSAGGVASAGTPGVVATCATSVGLHPSKATAIHVAGHVRNPACEHRKD
jgi:hypothetical protein